MAEIRFKFEGGEITPKERVTTLGRTTDNDISFPGDQNVSRFHAEIELRGSEYCLIDLNSSNGTTVNGEKVSGERYLKPGDRIVLGGTSEIVLTEDRGTAQEPTPAAEADNIAMPDLTPVGSAVQQIPSMASAPASAGSKTMLMVAGGAVLLAVVVAGVAGTLYYRRGSTACSAVARITSPEKFETLSKPTDIEVTIQGSGCVQKVVLTLDNKEVNAATEDPWALTLDPKEHPDQADAEQHLLGIVLVDKDGKRSPQSEQVPVYLETRKAGKDVDPNEVPASEPNGPDSGQPEAPKGKEVTLIDISGRTMEFSRRFAGVRGTPNQQFLTEVQKRAADFAGGGFYNRAAPHRDLINTAFVKSYSLPPALGYIFAMSRTGFDPKKQGDGEGMWRMSPALIATQKFGGDCTEPLTDPGQKCAANAAAAYLKEIYLNVCDKDMLCAAAAFGKPVSDAAAWRSGLPRGGEGLWNTLKPGPEREQLVRFIAAAIVAENPRMFGLEQERPISALYPVIAG